MSSTLITGITFQSMLHVLTHLRPADRLEIEAVRGRIDAVEMATQLSKLVLIGEGTMFVDRSTNEPVACLGSYPMTPSCAGCWAFGTDKWDQVVATVTKHIRRTMIPALLRSKFHRAECRALSSRDDTRRWLTGLGWREEAVLSGFGVRREDFTLFAWLADESANHLRQLEQQSELPLCGGG